MAYDDMSFSKAFAAARKDKGAGKTFTWKGKEYTTDYKEESGTSATSKPKARPANLNPQSGAARSTAGKVKPKGIVGASAMATSNAGVASKTKVAPVSGKMGIMPKKLSPQEMVKLTPKQRAARNQQATLARTAQRKGDK